MIDRLVSHSLVLVSSLVAWLVDRLLSLKFVVFVRVDYSALSESGESPVRSLRTRSLGSVSMFDVLVGSMNRIAWVEVGREFLCRLLELM